MNCIIDKGFKCVSHKCICVDCECIKYLIRLESEKEC